MQPLDPGSWLAPALLHPLEDHVRTAAAGGFTNVAAVSADYLKARSRGLGIEDVRGMAEDHGAPLRRFGTLATWASAQFEAA